MFFFEKSDHVAVWFPVTTIFHDGTTTFQVEVILQKTIVELDKASGVSIDYLSRFVLRFGDRLHLDYGNP